MVKKYISDVLMRVSLKDHKNFLDISMLQTFNFLKKIRDKVVYQDRSGSNLVFRATNLIKKIERGNVKFVSIDELIIFTNEWIKFLPQDIDIILGIPRSGLLVASLVSLKLGKPLTTPKLFTEGQYWVSKLIKQGPPFKHILIIDDSIDSGKTMDESLNILSLTPDVILTKAALFVTEKSKNYVDIYYKILPQPRIFEWNLVHAKKFNNYVMDLDGVLCENCPKGYDENEELYSEWIRKSKPYLIPTFSVDAIVSCRLEKYRKETEIWLSKHGVNYRELILWNLDCKSKREGYSQHKIKHILRLKPDIVFESNISQAKDIWEKTRVPTLCIDEMIIFS
jgi:orotate phosphoribosyltransferase